MKANTPKLKVKLDETKPEPVEIIAKAIVEISAAMKKINASRLKRRAVVTLIQAESGLGKGAIELVLNNLDLLEEIWLKPEIIQPK
jgi:hypothetical protein